MHEEAYSVESLEKPINTDNFLTQTLLITLCIAGGTFIGELFLALLVLLCQVT